MLNIPNPDYNPLEQRIGLLLHIGRDIKRRGEAGFNVDVELSGTDSKRQIVAGKDRFEAYQWLKDEELIRVTNSRAYLDSTGGHKVVDIDLTDKGKRLYEEAEKKYGEYLTNLKQKFG